MTYDEWKLSSPPEPQCKGCLIELTEDNADEDGDYCIDCVQEMFSYEEDRDD